MPHWDVPARVERVIDGDTVEVLLDLGWRTYRRETVRLEGIDAPERGTPEGEATRLFVLGLIGQGSLVRVVSHRLEKYGRTLGNVRLSDGRWLSDVLLAAGYAIPWPNS